MILTGRPAGAQEAPAMGLANRVVPRGQARVQAQRLAHEIARFPQMCVRARPPVSYERWTLNLEEAPRNEGRIGAEAVEREATSGAARFAAGVGRGGSFQDV
jgi:enoyl-CoA hydratase